MKSALVGRTTERERLAEALERARLGTGGLVLIGGEAGAGKTRLADDLVQAAGKRVLRGTASHGAVTPYGPVVAALRSYLRAEPEGLAGYGPLRPHLALMLPELGDPAVATDRATLFEAIRCALAHAAGDDHALLVLDDLQWSDAATLELLAGLVDGLADLPVLVVAAYRSDGLPRDHGLRRLRNDLRRRGHLDEILLEPLGAAETAELLEQTLGDRPSGSLVAAVQDRTQGLPFFVEELARALQVAGALSAGRGGLELAAHGNVPLPDTIRDAVLIGASELSEEARQAAEAAAVAGESFDLDLLCGVAADAGVEELLARGMLREEGQGVARFRHALTREALYADVPWLRRRALHRELAQALEQAGAPSIEIAGHWDGAREPGRARAALLRAAEEFEAVHAHRDAAEAGRQALELWPDGDDEGGAARIDALERYARCSELAGSLADALRAWREVCEIRAAAGDPRLLAHAQRRLAAVHELKGDREAAFAARRVAAEAYAASGDMAEAALDHLAMANHLRLNGRHRAAVELARTARSEAEAAGRLDVSLSAAGLEGVAEAKGGDFELGLQTVRDALGAALERDETAVAADLYQRLSLVLYDAADYPRAEEALASALELCRAADVPGTEVACVSCMAYVLRDRGEWARAAEHCRELIAAGTVVFVAEGLLGSIHCFQGRLSSARRLLSSSLAVSSNLGHYNMTIDSTAALAALAVAEGDHDEAAGHCRALLARWAESDDHHYALTGLRWAAVYSARRGDRAGAHAYTEPLTGIASDTGNAEALAALAHAIAERALHDGDADTAAEQLMRAVELHRSLDMPYVRAQIELRAGVALAAAGERDLALERMSDAYRTARKLGARPLAAEAAGEVKELGESVVRRLGSRAAADSDGAGLSRREVEVVRLLAVGRTNREIAQDLFLSTRTVDMHVRNILRKLDCRSRVEAANRAGELGLLVAAS